MLRKMKRKLAMVLAVVLMVTMMPIVAFAAGETLVADKAALTAAFAAGGNIQLTASIACGAVSGDIFTVGSGKTITLDLNDFQISGDTNTGGIIRNAGNLTIIDTSVAKGGTIINTNTTGIGEEVGGPSVQYSKSAISNIGTLIVNAGVTIAGPALGHGRYYSPDTYYFNPAYGIDNLGGGNVTINSATVTGSNCMRNFANVTGTTITVNGGTLTGRTGIAMQSFGTCIGSLTINAGTTITALYSAVFAEGVTAYNSIVINGGVFTGGDSVKEYGTIDVGDGTLTINGGIFNDITGVYYCLLNLYDGLAVINVTAGTFNGSIWGGNSTGSTTFAPATGKHIYVNGEFEGVVHGTNLTETNNIVNARTGYGYDTIAAAVAAANAGDTINVSGTIDLATAITVDKNVTILGTGVNPTINCSVAGEPSAFTMNQGELKNLTIKGAATTAPDGPNANYHGVTLYNTSKITDCTVKNLRTGLYVYGSNEVVGNTIQGNRTGIIYQSRLPAGSNKPIVKIVDNTITDNRTFGLLFQIGGTAGTRGLYDADYSFTIKGNEIYGNWYAELETRTANPFDLTGNYWGPQGPVLIHDYVNEAKHPDDVISGLGTYTKPGRPAGGIYQPTNSTSTTWVGNADFTNFTAGALTLDIVATPVAETIEVILDSTDPDYNTPDFDVIVVAAENIVPADASLTVTPLDVENTEIVDAIALAIQGEGGAAPVISAAYDISLNSAGVEVEPNGSITISLPIPMADRGKKIMVLHILDDGTVEILPATIVDGKAVFVTNSLSDFVLLAGNNVPVAFTATSAVGKAGSNVTVNVNIAADSASGTGTIVLPYDGTKLEVVSAVAGPALNGAVDETPFMVNVNAASNPIILSYICDDPAGFNVGGTILSVTYKIKTGTADGVLPVAPTVTEFCDTALLPNSQANNLSYTIDYGEILVDNTAPIAATFAPSTTAPTHDDVTVTITYPGDAAQMLYKIDGGSWTPYTTTLTRPANCIVYAKGIDTAGNETESHLHIENIDKVPPTAPTIGVSTTNATNQDVEVTITYTDTDSDIEFRQYSFNNTDWSAYSASFFVAANCTVYAKSTDYAGNVTEATPVVIGNIDKVVPGDAILSTADAITPTNSLTVSIVYPSAFAGDSAVKKYSYDSTTWFDYSTAVPVSIVSSLSTQTVSRTVYAKSQDAAGNWSAPTHLDLTNVVMVGDVFYDDKVSVVDALKTLSTATGKTTLGTNEFFAADVNHSHTVTALDALKILQFTSARLTAF